MNSWWTENFSFFCRDYGLIICGLLTDNRKDTNMCDNNIWPIICLLIHYYFMQRACVSSVESMLYSREFFRARKHFASTHDAEKQENHCSLAQTRPIYTCFVLLIGARSKLWTLFARRTYFPPWLSSSVIWNYHHVFTAVWKFLFLSRNNQPSTLKCLRLEDEIFFRLG